MNIKKTAVVTGAARGIGFSIAENLEGIGYNVVYADMLSTDKDFYVKCDISSQEDRANLLDATIKRFGRVDLLVNNAGVAPKVRMDILETTEESFDRLMDINLKGTFFMSQLFANQMIKQPPIDGDDGKIVKPGLSGESLPHGGRIINIASISSYTSSTARGEYCISKTGISMVTSLFADRLAEYGIGVFELRPGIILTDMTAVVKEKYEKLISEGITPIKRFGYPQDVADAVVGICKGHFDFSTGQVINVDGGFHIRRL